MTKSSWERIRRRMIREKAERDAEELGAAECRRRLAEWASQPGRTQAEIDELNAMGMAPQKLDS